MTPGSTTTAAHGVHTDRGRPRSATSLTPFVVVPGAAAAIDFYIDVLGARLVDRTDVPGPDGSPLVAHATLDLGLGQLQLGDPNETFRLVAPPPGEADCYSLGLYVEDVDAVVARAVAAGATVREPVADFVSGDRYAAVRDPFGVRWSIMTRVEDLSEEESAARVAQWAAGLSREQPQPTSNSTHSG